MSEHVLTLWIIGALIVIPAAVSIIKTFIDHVRAKRYIKYLNSSEWTYEDMI